MIRRCLGDPWFVSHHMLQKTAGVKGTVEVAEEGRTNRVEAIRNHDDLSAG